MGYTDCALETGVIPPRNCPGIYREFGAHCGFRTDHSVNLYTSPGAAFSQNIMTLNALKD